MSFDQDNRTQIGEYKVLLPDMPKKDKDFVNYNKSIDKQKFSRLILPRDLRTMKPATQKDYVNRMFHKRKHGEWWIIKDIPQYICGLNWYFLNFWWCLQGCYPDFRIADVVMFQWMRFEVINNPDCYGGLIIKSRREGMTEKMLCEGYEYVTRVKSKHFGMQNLNEKDIKKDYKRIVDAHKRMAFFFKPINQSSDKPAEGLIFEKPAERVTQARIEQEYGTEEIFGSDFESLGSKITFEPADLLRYDGDLVHRYRQGEYGKTPPATMDIIKRLGVITPCLHLYNGQKITGKQWWESTIEELGGGLMLERTNKLWADSNPTVLVNNRTKTGMKRLFRNALDTAEPDEYGYPKKEKTKKFLENAFAKLEKEQDWDALSDLQRKNPITLDHALTPSVSDTLFNALKQKNRLRQLQNDLWWDNGVLDSWGNAVKDIRRRGNFIWQDGIRDTRVIFIDDPNGKWWVSQLLTKDESNQFSYELGYRCPGRKHLYGFGIDPIDTRAAEGAKMSKPASALFRKLDMMIDGALFAKDLVDDEGNTTRAGDMKTHQYIATYCYRSDEANTFYEDMIMQAVYYGCECLYERNKGAAMRDYFKARGYWGYLSFRPDSTKTAATRDQEPGLPATDVVCENYSQWLMNYTSRYMDNCRHPELIYDGEVGWLTFRNTPESRKKHDLTVASGYAGIAAGDKAVVEKEKVVDDKMFDQINVMDAR